MHANQNNFEILFKVDISNFYEFILKLKRKEKDIK